MINATTLLAAVKVSSFAKDIGVPLTVAVIGLIATLAAAAISFALNRWSATTTARREGYAAATQELVAWAEYPYRIKRRTSDTPEVLTALADRGHTYQEALRYRETWIRSEDPWVAKVFADIRTELGAVVGPSCAEAWQAEPIMAAADMNLGPWGPNGVDAHIARFERAVAFRFGWRRAVGFFGWHPRA